MKNYKIIQIVRALWLATKPFYISKDSWRCCNEFQILQMYVVVQDAKPGETTSKCWQDYYDDL